jgi:hypothetical protein
MNKVIYIIASLHTAAPTYRLYDHDKAIDLLMAVREQWPEHEFWLGKKDVNDGHYMGTN